MWSVGVKWTHSSVIFQWNWIVMLWNGHIGLKFKTLILVHSILHHNHQMSLIFFRNNWISVGYERILSDFIVLYGELQTRDQNTVKCQRLALLWYLVLEINLPNRYLRCYKWLSTSVCVCFPGVTWMTPSPPQIGHGCQSKTMIPPRSSSNGVTYRIMEKGLLIRLGMTQRHLYHQKA